MAVMNLGETVRREVVIVCRTCHQIMKSIIDLPQDRGFQNDKITLNVAWCPFDTEEGRSGLLKGLRIAERLYPET